MTNHDRMFKQLITVFFFDFIKLFFPQVENYIDSTSVEFLEQEIFSDIAKGERYEADVVAKVKYKGLDTCFLIHVEPQAQHVKEFDRRMFRYFARLYEKYDLSIYPIAVFSFDDHKEKQPSSFKICFSDFEVLRFQYRIVQLNRLDYRKYLKIRNPVAVALATRMGVAGNALPRIKLECLRLLSQLRLDSARTYLISHFIDTYLKLTESQELEFQKQLEELPEKEEVMDMITSWKREGIEEGLARGREEGLQEGLQEGRAEVRRSALKYTKLILQSKYGTNADFLEPKIVACTTEQLDTFVSKAIESQSVEELEKWLDSQLS